MKRLARLVLSVLMLTAGVARSQSAPPLINYQGRIAGTDGRPLPTADYTLTATLWSAPAGGSNLWSESHPSTPVVQGFFNLILGGLSNGLADALAATNVHIEVTCSAPAATSTRQRLLSVPYAARAADAERVDGLDLARLTGFKPATEVGGMVLIPAGTFNMGDRFVEGGADELPVHAVTLSAFWMDKTEVTKAKWYEVKSWAIAVGGYSFDNGGSGKADNHPVHTVNWYDCVKWCNARSQMEGRRPCYYTDTTLMTVYTNGQVTLATNMVDWSADGYRLPTEAEWEFAARGGLRERRFPWGDEINHAYALYMAHGGDPYYDTDLDGNHHHPRFAVPQGVYPYTAPQDSFGCNGYGLEHMTGNLWEWCWDWYASAYYASSPERSPQGPPTGSVRVMRGGSWSDAASMCRVTKRYENYSPDGTANVVGFRTIRIAP